MREPITAGMEFLHSCAFCDWQRASATPVMLSPSCDRCGCALDAAVAHTDPSVEHARVLALPRAITLAALRCAGALLCLLVLYAAAKVGYHAGGAAGGMIALGAGGFLLLPFVPERIG